MCDLDKLIQLATTTETDEQARRLARQLVEHRLAACVQITGPIRSVYWWQDQMEESREWRVLIKTQSRMFDPICRFLREHHPYELPQVVGVPLEYSSPEYAAWVAEQLADELSGPEEEDTQE